MRQVTFHGWLGERITLLAQKMYKKAMFVHNLELLNEEGEDTFFTSSVTMKNSPHQLGEKTNFTTRRTDITG